MVKEQFFPISREGPIAISTEALTGYPIKPSYVRQELVVASPDEIGDDVDWKRISGVHFRTKKAEAFPQEALYKIMKEAASGGCGYVTIHLEDLWRLIDKGLIADGEKRREAIEQKLIELNAKAQETGISLLLENVTPRVDHPKLPSEFWSLFAFEQMYGDLLNRLSNLGYCLDIAHLGLAEPHVLRVWERVFESRLNGIDDLSQVLSDEELKIWELTGSVISRTKTIHWSRARERRKPVDQGAIFRTARFLAQRFPQGLLGLTPEKIHDLYSKVENFRSAHLSLISDPDMFSMILAVLEELNWQGEMVLESPILFKKFPKIREGRIDTMDEFYTLKEWNYGVRKRILEKTFRKNRIFGNDLVDLLSFPFSEELGNLSPEFFSLLQRIFPLLVEVYPLDVRRKVNKGLYLRHILRTMVLADKLYQEFREKGVKLSYEVLITAAALHDAIEINRKNDREISVEYLQQRLQEIGFEEKDAYNISHIARFLMPQKNPSLSYFEQKRQDFERIWEGEGLKGAKKKWWEVNKDYLRAIKAADILANLEETVDDLRNGRENGRMKHSLQERSQVFEYRIRRIKELFGT